MINKNCIAEINDSVNIIDYYCIGNTTSDENLDNYEYECDGKIHYHDSLEELKHWNTEISINFTIKAIMQIKKTN